MQTESLTLRVRTGLTLHFSDEVNQHCSNFQGFVFYQFNWICTMLRLYRDGASFVNPDNNIAIRDGMKKGIFCHLSYVLLIVSGTPT